MKNTDNDNELIESFLDGTLNDQEKEAFLARLETDAALAKAFDERRLLQESYVEASKRI